MKQTQWIAIFLMMVLVCCASCVQKDVTGEQAIVGEQVVSTAEEKKPNTQTPSDSAEEQPLDGGQAVVDEQVQTPSDSAEKQPTENSSDSMVRRVEPNDYPELVRITKDELGELFDYDIYYYQIENFYIDVDGKEMELRQALKKDPKILDALYAEWKEDHGTTGMYNDGGSISYPYENYTALKCRYGRVIYDNNFIIQDLILAPTKSAMHQAWDALKDQKDLEHSPRVLILETNTLTCLTEGALGEHFDYEIYYYGIGDLNIEIDGWVVDFREAITQDPTVLDRLYDQWEQQFGSDNLAYDGGSACYDFGEYRIYKLNVIEWDDANQTNKVRKDLIITRPNITLDEAKEATK